MSPHGLSDDVSEEPAMRESKPNRPATPNKQAKAAAEHDELRSAWDESMEGVGGIGLPHRNVSVLLISWEDKLDDLHTGGEVDALEAVFKNSFGYKVVKQQLVAGKHEPQIQVHKMLVDFVYEYDDEASLLIVYYAGHGIPGKKDTGGGILLAGNRTRNEKMNSRNSVVWTEAEMIIKRTKADVLVIFDCCYAGVLAKMTRSMSDRNFEFLAACGSDDVTAMPGETSFTSALIWSLELLVKSKSSFTTQDLLRKINEQAPNFPKHQHALLMERGEDETRCFRKLVLAALPKPGEKDNRQFPVKNEKPASQIKHYLDLRFFYDKPPTKDEILSLSRGLKEMIANETITARHIGWLRMTDLVRNSIDQWKRRMTITKQKVSPWAAKLASDADQMSPQELISLNDPMTPPPSDSGNNDASVDSTPSSSEAINVESSNVNVQRMTIAKLDTLNLNAGDISTARLRRLLMGGPDYLYRPKIFVVGLVVLLLECFHRLCPREAPAIVLLSFSGYAWYMTNLYARTTRIEGSPGISSYFPLLIGGISLFICSRLLFTDRGIGT